MSTSGEISCGEARKPSLMISIFILPLKILLRVEILNPNNDLALFLLLILVLFADFSHLFEVFTSSNNQVNNSSISALL